MKLASLSAVTDALWTCLSAGHSAEKHRKTLVARIHQARDDYRERPTAFLADSLAALRSVAQKRDNIACEELILPVFALTAEAVRRALGTDLYDVQLLAGIVLADKAVAEMKTGEGKTLAAAAPAVLYALQGQGVHVMTVNAYLARRDFDTLRPVYQLLGLSVGLLEPGGTPIEKRQAYQAEITYGPGYEFGFDYLRDQTLLLNQSRSALGESVRRRLRGSDDGGGQIVQRGHAFAIVDEADSVFLDEAVTPLILSEGRCGTADDADAHRKARDVANMLDHKRDFYLDRPARIVALTPAGHARVAQLMADAPADRLCRGWSAYVEKALFAQLLLRRDVDYFVADGRVLMIDEPTGRIHADRFWQDGLHQAIEAKEGVPITNETRPVARISRQRYFRRYRGLCGMTGTAAGSEDEFWEGYRLPVVRVPTRRPCRRHDLPTRYFGNAEAKWDAVVAEIADRHRSVQPILVGARTIENSDLIAGRLRRVGIPHQVLNGTQDAEEAAIVAKAGQTAAVTIATNVAGRGTDIVLGGGVFEKGGLHVIGAERHGASRIDRQLAGRAARQGDPGSSRFYVSADDQLVIDHAPALRRRLREYAGPTGEVVGDFASETARAQREAEKRSRQLRQQWLDFDDWRENALEKLEKAD